MADEDGGLGNGTTRPLTEGDYGANWIAAAQTGSRNTEPRPNLFNAVLALRHDPAWRDAFGFDEMLCAPVYRHTNRQVEDYHVFMLHHWLQSNGIETMAIDPVREAIELVARDYPFHPLRAKLNALEWDGEPRLSGWLARYFGTADDNYHASIGCWFLVQMVARVMRPGCKADYMLVLEGPQGLAKSQASSILAWGYFSDTLPDLGGDHVRISMHLRGKWLIEVSELSAFNRSEASRLKAFLTSQTERYTPKYARLEVTEPRQCVFVGTTNNDHYLRDDTGGRRFWPVKCGTIDLEGLERDRDKLFAEAVAEFRAGKAWWPERQIEEKIISPEQETRFEVDAWEETIRTYLLTRLRVTTMQVATAGDCLNFLPANFKLPDQKRVAAILRRADWVAKKEAGGGRYWVPGNPPQ